MVPAMHRRRFRQTVPSLSLAVALPLQPGSTVPDYNSCLFLPDFRPLSLGALVRALLCAVNSEVAARTREGM